MEHNFSDAASNHCTIPAIAHRLANHLSSHSFSLPDADQKSVIDLLYTTYADCLGQDRKEIQDGFLALGDHLEHLPLDENNAIFSIVCELCGAYEQRAFEDALQLGAYLMLELQEQHNPTQ